MFRMKGEYLKNCNCLATCACDTAGIPSPHKFCEGLVGMRITDGEVDGVKLDGLSWVVAVHFPGALHEGNGTAEVYIDQNATEKQRQGLIAILTGQQGGPLFEILSQIITTIHGPHFVPITCSSTTRGGARTSRFQARSRRAPCLSRSLQPVINSGSSSVSLTDWNTGRWRARRRQSSSHHRR